MVHLYVSAVFALMLLSMPLRPALAESSMLIDTFSRNVSDGWSRADSGQSYELTGRSDDFKVADGMGTMLLPAASAGRDSLLSNASYRDVDAYVQVQTSKAVVGYGQYASIITRGQANGDAFQSRIRFSWDGSVWLQALRISNNRETFIGKEIRVAGLRHRANAWFSLRTQLTGVSPTTIRIKAWAGSEDEPTTWSYNASDRSSTLQAGTVGLRGYLARSTKNAPVSINFEDLKVLPASSSPPPPPSSHAQHLPDTNYAIPAGALFVAPSGDDADAGTLSQPFRTLEGAVDEAPNGSTIVLRAGVYRESVTWYGKRLTLQPYPHEQVWFSGSRPITSWTAVNGRWRTDDWTARFRQGGLPPEFTDLDYPLSSYPDQVFIDNEPVRQVGSLSEVTSGTFWVDYANSALWIGDDPADSLVEGSTLAQALYVNKAHGSVIRGLGFMHYATHVAQGGAVRGDANDLVFEANAFVWNAAAGLSVLGTDTVVRTSAFIGNGQLGLHGHKSDRLIVEGNYVARNNVERFHITSAEGGMKVTAARDMIWRDNLVEDNYGRGMWADISCYNTMIVRNVVRRNEHNGIQYEISDRAVIASNVVTENGEYGVYINESGDVDVYNNTLSRNKQNIRVWEGYRIENVYDVTIRNNILSNTTEKSLLGVLSHDNFKAGSAMGVSIDQNYYFRTSPNSPGSLVEWSVFNNVNRFSTLADIQAEIGQENNGEERGNTSVNPFFINEEAEDYRLHSTSIAQNGGQSLPQGIADAIGVSAGVTVDAGALHR